MKRFEGKEFLEQLREFLEILDRENFKSYLLFKINFKKPNHSDVDILTTKYIKLIKILKNKGYKIGRDLRYYKKGKIPIDVHDKIKWNFIQFNTKRLMVKRVIKKMNGKSFYYVSPFDDLIIKFVHYFYTKGVEIKWKFGKKLGLKK